MTAKDIVLYIIRIIGTDGATGHVIEYAGEAIAALSMEERMTVCNMSIEAGARAGMIAPDDKTLLIWKGESSRPRQAFEGAVEYWKTLPADEGAAFDRELELDVSTLAPQVSWGTNPGMVTDATGDVPDPSLSRTRTDEGSSTRLGYMAT